MIKNLYNYREFLKTSVLKEFRGKYKKSFLGVLWSFINPLLQLFIYSVVFSFIMKNDIDNYAIFLVVALIPWTFFNTTIIQSTSTIVTNGGILKKIYFPREILPRSVVSSTLFNFLISCLIIVVALIVSGVGISVHILLFPVVLLIQYVLLIGCAYVLSSITVFIRDLEYFINVLMMLLFYLTPIVYDYSMIPNEYRMFFNLNPVLHLVNAYRDILYYQQIPDVSSLCILAVVSFGLLFVGYKLFKKLERNFVEEL